VNCMIKAMDIVGLTLAATIEPGLVEAIHADDTPWESVIELANDELLSPAMWSSLHAKGLTEELPVEVRDYLQELHGLNLRRNSELRSQCDGVIRALNDVGIDPVLLKGAAHLYTDTFRDPGARMMKDLDLLVPADRIEDAVFTLTAIGYSYEEAEAPERFTTHHHCAPLYRAGSYGFVELHHDLTRTARHILPASRARFHTRRLQLDTGCAHVLTPTYRVLHNFVHSEVVDRHHVRGEISLRYLHDLVGLVSAYGTEIDWRLARDVADGGGAGRLLQDYLYLANRLLALPIPGAVTPSPLNAIHFHRCRLRLRSAFYERLDWGTRRFSARDIEDAFGPAGSWRALTVGRLRRVCQLLSKVRG